MQSGGTIEPLVVPISTARALLGNVCRQHIYSLVSRGQLDLKKIGGRSTITTASIRRLVGEEVA